MAKILIVEDNEMNMRLFSDLLEVNKHTTIKCLDGLKALELVKTEKPDLVIMDIQMPEISGLEVTAQIRKTPKISKTKILAVSAFAMDGDKERILKAGCDGYISKPISVPNFIETINEFLKK